MQPASHLPRRARPRRHPRGRRHRLRIPAASDPGDLQAADREPRPQPRLPLARRGALRLPDRRRRADDRLRQDHAVADHGGGDRRYPRDRAVGRADAQRLVQGRAHGLGHHRVEGARDDGARRDRLQRVPRAGRVVGAVGRPLQHDGHGVDDELPRRGARHEPAGLRGDPRARIASASRWPTSPASASSRWCGRI